MTDQPIGVQRHRSPAYPRYSLKKAVEMVKLFFKAEGLNRVPIDIATEDIGYSPTSSSGMRALATLLHFGLFDEEGAKDDRLVWVSDLARDIIEDWHDDPSERIRAIQEAALLPPIHNQIWERWGSELPSERALRRVLEKEYSFNPKVIAGFIEELHETFEFAQLLKTDAEPSKEVDRNQEVESYSPPAKKTEVPKVSEQSRESPETREFGLPLTDEDEIVLRVPRRKISRRDFDRIAKWLNLIEDALVEEDSEI